MNLHQPTLRLLQRSVRRRLIHNVGQILREVFQRLVDRQPEMTGEFLQLGVAEHGFQLVFTDRQV